MDNITIERAKAIVNRQPSISDEAASEKALKKFYNRLVAESPIMYEWITNYKLQGIQYLKVTKSFLYLVTMAASYSDHSRPRALHRILNFLVYMNSLNPAPVIRLPKRTRKAPVEPNNDN